MFESIPQTIEGRYPVRVSVWNPRTNKEKTMICWADCGIYYAYCKTFLLKSKDYLFQQGRLQSFDKSSQGQQVQTNMSISWVLLVSPQAMR